MEYSPASLVDSVRVRPVAVCVAVTFAPCTTPPDASVTVPRIVPRTLWATERDGRNVAMENRTGAKLRCWNIVTPLTELRTKDEKERRDWAERPYGHTRSAFFWSVEPFGLRRQG